MFTRSSVTCAALVLSVVTCKGKSASERIAEHERVRVSWMQTVRLVAAEWIERALPDAYATRTLARASEELRAESDAVRKEDLPDDARTRLNDSLAVARALADSFEHAVRRSDRGAAARIVAHSPRVNADSLLRLAGLR